MKTHALASALFVSLFAPDAVAAPDPDTAVTLGSVEARRGTGVTLASREVLTSVDVLGADQIGNQNVMNSWELLGQMPGIQLTETRQGAESGKATFRAFNGEGYINGIKILIDGIPSNVNSGNQRFVDMLFPLDIDYIEVVRGTNDPRYGLHNIGGNINFGTRQGGSYGDARVSYGSFNTREAQLAIGRESNGVAQNYFIGTQASDGYRDHDQSSKYSLAGKWFVGSDEAAFKAGVIARVYHHEADEPGFLTADELASARRASPAKNANDGDVRDMYHLSTHLDLRLSERLQFSSKLYYNRYQDDRQVTFTDYRPGNAPRQRRQWDEAQTGLLGTLTWRAGARLHLAGGLNIEQQDNAYRRLRHAYAIPTDFDGVPARVQNDDRYSLDNVGAYLQTVVQPTNALKIVAAYRIDRFSGDTHLPGGIRAPLQRSGWIGQPKLSMAHAFGPRVDVYANWGRSFQVLTGSTAPAYLTAGQAAFRPSINTGKELGIRLRPTQDIDVRLAAWQQDATDEVANMPATGTSVGLGQTRRRGVDLQLNARVNAQWTLWASHALQQATVISAHTVDGHSLAGNDVLATPRYISNIGVDYRPDLRWRFGLQGRMQGDYFIEETNQHGRYGGFAVLDASADYALTDRLSVAVQLKNLTGRQYAYAWYDNFFWGGDDQPMFSPAPGRTAFVSMRFTL